MSQRGMADRSISRAVGGRLWALRKRRGWSQDVVADRVGLSQMTIARYERGSAPISIDALVLLADLYGQRVEDLIYPENRRHVG